MKKGICIVLCLVLSAVLAVLLWHEKTIEDQTDALSLEMSTQTRALSIQISKLEQQISELENAASAAKVGTATTQLLVTDLSARSYAEIISPLVNYAYPVGLALSLSEYPGAEGCLTADEALSLVEQGWYFCYSYDEGEAAALSEDSASADEMTDEEASDALALWLAAVEEAAAAQGLEMCTAVYFPSGSFREGFADVLKARGVQTVIHSGELGAGLLNASREDGLWYVGSAWWRSNSVLSNKLDTISADGGELVTLMGVDGSATDTLDDWMAQYEDIVERQGIRMTDFSDMAAVQTENAALEADTSQETQIAALEAQIEELEKQMEEIQEKYLEQIGSLGK